jgi:hypothetical protein
MTDRVLQIMKRLMIKADRKNQQIINKEDVSNTHGHRAET